MARSTSTSSAARPAPPPVAKTAAAKPTFERIAQRAYEKWLNRGCPHDSATQDWLEAEAELTAEMSRPAVPAPAAARR